MVACQVQLKPTLFMKITMIGQKGVPSRFGGIETHVTELSTRLVRAGHEVVAYTRPWYATPGSDRYNGIQLISLPSIHTKHLDAISHTFFATVHACLFVRPDIMHFHGVGPSLLAWIPRILRPQAIVITTFHCVDREHEKWGTFARWMLSLGERACVRLADATIVVSKTLKQYIADSYKAAAAYIPNGITPRRVTTDSAVLRSFGLTSYQYVAMVSRLVRHKGAHTLVAAWQKARALRPELFKDMKLAIVGDSAFTDAYVKELKKLAANEPSIVFTGYQQGETLSTLFSGARFMVHPSTSEGLPIAILEAMSFGKAVIAADIPVNLEVIAEHGLSFPAGDIDVLAEQMIACIEDPMLCASIGHAARELVETEYHWDDIGEATANLYTAHVALREGVRVVGV